jgi:CHAT domain
MAISYDPQEFDDLEIAISPATDGHGYLTSFRLPEFGRFTDSLPPLPIPLLEGAPNPRIYGEQLSQWLFRDEVAKAFSYARGLATESTRGGHELGARIRLRLSLDPSSSELRSVCWECLYAPDSDLPLSLTTAFSRFMRVGQPHSWPFRERPLRMLLIISNPEGIDRFALDEIDPDMEKSLIKEATSPLGPLLQLDRLRESPTLAQIRSAGEKGYHIVHLLASAAFHDDRGYLILPDDNGRAEEVAVEEVVRTVVLPSYPPPGLVFLAVPLVAREVPSVARERSSGTLVSLGQMLIEAGVQALIAIQPPIGASDMLRFIRRFYAVLMRTGVIDVAMAEARTEIYRSDNWEWTYPVLYMRIPDGQLFQPLPEKLEGTMAGISINSIG